VGFRLVGQVDGKVIEILIGPEHCVLGSAADCDLQLDHASVSRHHARLVARGDEVEIVDLGSQNGTFCAGRQVISSKAAAGTEIRVGDVRLMLERIPDGDLETVFPLPPTTAQEESAHSQVEGTTTLGMQPSNAFAGSDLPRLLLLLAQGAGPARMAAAAGAAAFNTIPMLGLEIALQHDNETAVLFTAHQKMSGSVDTEPVISRQGDVLVEARFPHPAMGPGYATIVESLALLVVLAGANPAIGSTAVEAILPPLPEPETVDDEMRRIYEKAAVTAAGDVGVLISGESGTGKEVLARYVHSASPRRGGRFVALNCAALPRDLLETELFGIERGVATGVDARPGKSELAHGGTLFLDEIGDMSLETQASILRVLHETEVYRIGSSSPRPADVRIIAATNRDISKLLDHGTFREDLYYRIAVWEVMLPALRHRKGDIANLAAFFLEREARTRGVAIGGISRSALEILTSYSWPGNVRQLEKEMARAALFVADGGPLTSVNLSPKLHTDEMQLQPPLLERLVTFEKREIIEALQHAGGDVRVAARGLGLGRSTLYRRLKALGIDPAPFVRGGDVDAKT
jgi:transcriptional regulator of acetoin/glycerol metabolism